MPTLLATGRLRPTHLGLAVLLFCLLFSTARAQSVPNHVVDGTYIREWLVLGPFPSDDLGEDFLAAIGGEETVAPREGDTVRTADGSIRIWQRYRSRRDFVDLSEILGEQQNATAYVYCQLKSDSTGESGFRFASSDAFVHWLNGELFALNLREGTNRCLIKIAHGDGPWGFALQLLPPTHAVLSGLVTDEQGQPIPFANLSLYQGAALIEQVQTDFWGNYEIGVYPVRGQYDLSATAATRGTWQQGLRLQAGEQRQLTLQLGEATSIAGTLLMPDEATPHVAVPVQALRIEADSAHVVATTLSDIGGHYAFVNLKPGRYRVRCQVLGGYRYYSSATAHATETEEILTVSAGTPLSAIDFRFVPFKKGTWRNYRALDQVLDDNVLAIHGVADGTLWFGTRTGATHYDGTKTKAIDRYSGLKNDWVNAIASTPDGNIWLGTEGGVYWYDGTVVHTLDALEHFGVLDLALSSDGSMWIATNEGAYRYDSTVSPPAIEPLPVLEGVFVWALYSTPDGAVWFATERGVYRHDGTQTAHFTTADGLAADFVTSIARSGDGTLWFGTQNGLVSRDPHSGEFSTLSTADGLVHDFVNTLQVDGDGVVWVGTDRGVSRYDGQTFVNFTTADGLAGNHVWAIYADRENHVWFGTESGGVSRYDSQTFVNFTIADGLTDDDITHILIHPDKSIWFGTGYAAGDGGGVSRYDGEKFTTFTVADGLAANTVHTIERASDGSIWFGTIGGGASRYNGEYFETYTSLDGLFNDHVSALYQEPGGDLWFGMGYISNDVETAGGGVSRYDGKEFVSFTSEDGLPVGPVCTIYRARDGSMWFGTLNQPGGTSERFGGVSHYDGEKFTNYTAADELGGKSVFAIHQDADSTMWFGTMGGGLTRYDGKEFVNFTSKNGLAGNFIQEGLHRATNGILWVGTNNGVSGTYDGLTWTTIDKRDGLVGNEVRSIVEDTDGYLWIGTKQGVSRYKRSTSKPRVRIDFAQSVDERYDDLNIVPSIETDAQITIGYHAIDFKTIPEKRQYRHRIPELSEQWSQPTAEMTADFIFASTGTYTFEVQAIDRDLNYSEPARLQIEVIPQYGRIAMISGLIVLSLALVLAGNYGLRRRRERDLIREQLVEELERELQTAHDMQISLMPTEPPHIAGIDIAGQCLPATQVGGDIFQYFQHDGKLALSVADVTGHGMEAAVPVMAFSGILRAEMQYGHALGLLFDKLNKALCDSLERRTFICFTMGELYIGSPESDSAHSSSSHAPSYLFRLSNSGCPYPCHYRAADNSLVELQISAYPLGIRQQTTYEVTELHLEPGDRVIFFSDGLVEAASQAGEFFGFERLAEVIRTGCAEDLSAQALLQRIFQQVTAFTGSASQEDDQTLVVLHIEH